MCPRLAVLRPAFEAHGGLGNPQHHSVPVPAHAYRTDRINPHSLRLCCSLVGASGSVSSSAAGGGDSVAGLLRHPAFPLLPPETPLTFVLAVKACLSADLTERPAFPELLQIFDDVTSEVASGSYIDSSGERQVRSLPHLPARHPRIPNQCSAVA